MRTDPSTSRARRSVDLRRARRVLAAVLAGWCGTARADTGECANLNIEITARVTPWRGIIESQDAEGGHSQADRCATLARMMADLADVRAAYDDRHETPGGDLSCDQAQTVLDGDADWVRQHGKVLGCSALK